MRRFQKGEKAKLADLTPATDVTVGVQLEASGGDVDISCFGIDAAGKLSDDRYFIFYNQKASPEGAITALGATDGDRESFAVRLGALPASITRLVFTATIDGPGTMASVSQGCLRLADGAQEAARYEFTGGDFSGEKAIILGELYRKDVWRFTAVGQGFNGGLSALLAHFGGTEADTAPAAPPAPPPPQPVAPPAAAPPLAPPPPVPAAPPAPAPAPPTLPPPSPAAPPPPAPSYGPPPAAAAPPPPPPAAGGTVNLGKVTLEKKGQARSVNLTKGSGNEPLHFNLNWSANTAGQGRGLRLTKTRPPDLDLGCMFELVTGEKSVIQPLGGNYGNAQDKPWIWLDKDDRSGVDVDGENLWAYRPDQIRRMLVFALIYEGASDFKSVGATLTITDAQGGITVLHLDNPDFNRTLCAICTVTNTGSTLEIRKEEQYFRGAHEADEHFKFGFQWRAGKK